MFGTLNTSRGPLAWFSPAGRSGSRPIRHLAGQCRTRAGGHACVHQRRHFAPESVTVMPGHADMVAMVPPFVPFPGLMVYATGVLEFLGALGLVLFATRSAAGTALATLFVLMFPANVYAAIADVTFDGDPATPLWFRIPEQIVFITIALWGAGRLSRPGPDHAAWPRAAHRSLYGNQPQALRTERPNVKGSKRLVNPLACNHIGPRSEGKATPWMATGATWRLPRRCEPTG